MVRPQTPSIGFDIFANVSLGSIESFRDNVPPPIDVARPRQMPNNHFEANVYKPHLSGQIFWKSRIFTLNFGVRYSLINFYDGLASGQFDINVLERATELIEVSPTSNIEYDLKLSTGNNNIASFLSISWNQKNELFRTENSTFAFGIDINISSIFADTYRKEKSN